MGVDVGKRSVGGVSASLLTLAVLLSTCSSDYEKEAARTAAALVDGTVKKRLQGHFDSHRQCAAVLRYDRSSRLFRAQVGSPRAQALVSSGLLEPAPDAPIRGEASFRPAASAAKWFTPMKVRGLEDEPVLCFARREVTDVWLAKPGSTLIRYSFRLVDPAPWTSLPAIRQAFPTVPAAFDVTLPGDEAVHLSDGRIEVEARPIDNSNTILTMFNVGFRDYTLAEYYSRD